MTTASRETAYISSTLKGVARTMSAADRKITLQCFEHWRGEWESIRDNEPQNVAHTVHCSIEERMDAMRLTSKHARDIKCHKGCAACCHINVEVFEHEAKLLHFYAASQDIQIDRARLQRQAVKTIDTWHELTPEDRRCVFLAEDRSCRVHEHRPGSCRKYVVITDPDLCDMVKHPKGEVGIVFDIQAEIIQSAAMTVYGVGNMAAQLLKVMTP